MTVVDERRVPAEDELPPNVCWLCRTSTYQLFGFRGLVVYEDCFNELAFIAAGRPEPGQPVPCRDGCEAQVMFAPAASVPLAEAY